MKKKVLILGTSGFIGRHMMNYIHANFHDKNYIFYFVGRNEFEGSLKGLTYLKLDLLEVNNLKLLFDLVIPDYIINLAGTLDSSDIDYCLTLNAELPRKILDTIIDRKIKLEKILYIGSAAEYGLNNNMPLKEDARLEPITTYGLSKCLQTEYVKYYSKKFNLPINIARTFNIIGSLMSDRLSIGSFIKQINESKDGDTIFVGNLTSKRDYLYIDDVIDAFFKILFNGIPGQIYNVCSGQEISMRNILDNLIRVSGKNIKVAIKPEFVKVDDVPVSYGDNQLLKKDVNWVPNYLIENIYHKLL